jgi:aryl-alcohol dehydrogenase-like predicted oxidoreductase
MNTNHIATLGFGLSSLAGSGNFAHQERLIRTAIEEGITHFDTAPYYGSGDAERLLGKILASVPEPVTIATKYGIEPVGGGRMASLLRRGLRPVFRQFGGLKRVAARVVHQLQKPKHTVAETASSGDLTRSLERSTDLIGRPIDLFLLHDASYDYAAREDIRGELDAVRERGLIRAAGTTGTVADVRSAVSDFPATYRIAQLENSLALPAPVGELAATTERVITYRAISSGLGKLRQLLLQPDFLERWQTTVFDRPADEAVLARVLLEYAIYQNKGGTVLFSTRKPERIRQLARAIHDPLLGPAQLDHLSRLLASQPEEYEAHSHDH